MQRLESWQTDHRTRKERSGRRSQFAESGGRRIRKLRVLPYPDLHRPNSTGCFDECNRKSESAAIAERKRRTRVWLSAGCRRTVRGKGERARNPSGRTIDEGCRVRPLFARSPALLGRLGASPGKNSEGRHPIAKTRSDEACDVGPAILFVPCPRLCVGMRRTVAFNPSARA
jgi:hypothetical protein